LETEVEILLVSSGETVGGESSDLADAVLFMDLKSSVDLKMAGSIDSVLLSLKDADNRVPLVVRTASFEISCLERNSIKSRLLKTLDFGVSLLMLSLMAAVDRMQWGE
jgi:hypothetical protein